jgi:hypothetical protein
MESRELLLKYFRNGCLSRSDKLLSFLLPSVLFSKNGKVISNAFKKVAEEKQDFENTDIQIENYSAENVRAIQISNYLNTHIKNELVGAYVHGSLGTYEEISYSDFDGFVILKNDVLNHPEKLKKVAKVLIASEKIMFEMDPLQHHGWFLLTETDLNNYPEYYLPHGLFQYSKCLFGEANITVRLKKSGYREECYKSFNQLSDGILTKLNSKIFLTNYYNFKNLLSEFMLLPAIYFQVKTGNGIFKKFSFEKLKNELEEKYAVMDEISSIRSDWGYKAPFIYKLLRSRKIPLINNIASKYFSGSLPSVLKAKFDEMLILRMKNFVYELKLSLEK